jgi:hypothetical protein
LVRISSPLQPLDHGIGSDKQIKGQFRSILTAVSTPARPFAQLFALSSLDCAWLDALFAFPPFNQRTTGLSPLSIEANWTCFSGHVAVWRWISVRVLVAREYVSCPVPVWWRASALSCKVRSRSHLAVFSPPVTDDSPSRTGARRIHISGRTIRPDDNPRLRGDVDGFVEVTLIWHRKQHPALGGQRCLHDLPRMRVAAKVDLGRKPLGMTINLDRDRSHGARETQREACVSLPSFRRLPARYPSPPNAPHPLKVMSRRMRRRTSGNLAKYAGKYSRPRMRYMDIDLGVATVVQPVPLSGDGHHRVLPSATHAGCT